MPKSPLRLMVTIDAQVDMTIWANRAIAVVLFLAAAPSAYASGDPGIFYWLFFFLVWDIGFGASVLYLQTLRKLRLSFIGIYLLCAIATWVWFWNVPGPDFTLENVVMVLWPPALVAVFFLISRRNGLSH